jgi:hypothetical protein
MSDLLRYWWNWVIVASLCLLVVMVCTVGLLLGVPFFAYRFLFPKPATRYKYLRHPNLPE